MFRNRLLILLGGCFLAASAAWADDIGFVDCSSHSDGIQVFAKPRKTPDVLASVPCGERFTVLVYGFVFSQIQTRDGRVGFVYSNMIAIDRNATSVQQSGSLQVASARTKVLSTPAATVTPNPPAAAQSQPVAAQPAPTSAAAPLPNVPQPIGTVEPAAPSTPAQAQTTEVSLTSAPAPAPAPVPVSTVPESPASTAQPVPPASAQPEPAPAQPQAVLPAPAPTREPASHITESAAPVPQPEPPAAAQPQPASPQPAAAPIRPKTERSSWEKPNSAIRKPTLFEFYGGYAFARLSNSGGGTYSNLNGAMGSVGLTLRPWLQIVADSTYNYTTSTGVKNVLYGNHFGARYFYRSRNRFRATPFVEGMVGGSRADTTITGTGGYTYSSNCISYKVGGGLDIHPTRHWEFRLIDVDYYRTAFGTNMHQNNYWVTTGVVLHLFGGGSQ
ncbi:MAG TPA: hypothetical protein VIX11_01175 [Candidatus Acidoferrum sp.]